MAADHDLEMEDMNLNMDRDMKGELEEEKEMREDRGGKDTFKNKKVHRVVSKWMLPEKVQRTYLERANCLPPPRVHHLHQPCRGEYVGCWALDRVPLGSCKKTGGSVVGGL